VRRELGARLHNDSTKVAKRQVRSALLDVLDARCAHAPPRHTSVCLEERGRCWLAFALSKMVWFLGNTKRELNWPIYRCFNRAAAVNTRTLRKPESGGRELHHFSWEAISRSLRRRLMLVLAVIAAEVLRVHAPPAIFLPVCLHFQMPTASRLTHSLPVKGDRYLAFLVTSNFLTIFLRVAPNLVPYLPTRPL